MTSMECCDLPAVLPQQCYDSKLSGERCSDEDYALVKGVVETLNLKTFREYHDLYLWTDVLALADCFEAFRPSFYKALRLDPAHFITLPSSSWQAILLKTKKTPELVCESNGGEALTADISEGVMGGQSVCFQPYAMANNPGMGEHYIPSQSTSWILYLDINSQYPEVMCGPLPIRELSLSNSCRWWSGAGGEIDKRVPSERQGKLHASCGFQNPRGMARQDSLRPAVQDGTHTGDVVGLPEAGWCEALCQTCCALPGNSHKLYQAHCAPEVMWKSWG